MSRSREIRSSVNLGEVQRVLRCTNLLGDLVEASKLTIPVTIAASLVVSAVGTAAAVTWTLADAYRRIGAAEEKANALETKLRVLQSRLTADPKVEAHPEALPLYTTAGISCPAGSAISALSVSSETFYATWKCVAVLPDLR